jgi:hypothetical protein
MAAYKFVGLSANLTASVLPDQATEALEAALGC